MITHLSINNLKLHNHTNLKLNGLTILTGMNGYGKIYCHTVIDIITTVLYDERPGFWLKSKRRFM